MTTRYLRPAPGHPVTFECLCGTRLTTYVSYLSNKTIQCNPAAYPGKTKIQCGRTIILSDLLHGNCLGFWRTVKIEILEFKEDLKPE